MRAKKLNRQDTEDAKKMAGRDAQSSAAFTAPALARRDWLALLLVLFVAGVLRFGNPGIVEFLHDEAMLALRAQDWLAGGAFPTVGIPSSTGVPNPPVTVYIMAVPYLFSDSPLVATMYVAALNVAGVALLWLMAQRYFGPTVALTAGLIYALNPWAVLYSRKIWAQDFHTPFVLLGLLLALYGFHEGKRWAQVLALPALIFAFQIHFAGWALAPLFIWLLWRGRGRIFWRALALSVALAGVTLAPYALGLAQTYRENPEHITGAFERSSGRGLALTGDPATFVARLATGVELETWVAPQQQDDLLQNAPRPTALWAIIGGLALLGAVVIWRGKTRALAPLALLWIALPLAVFTLDWTPVFPHYFTATLPALALLAGVGIAWLARHTPGEPYSRIGLLAGLGAILLTQGAWWNSFLRYADATKTLAGFGTPVHYLLDVRDELAQYDDVVIVSDGFEVLYDREPAAWSALLHDEGRCVRTLTGDGLALFPEGPFAAAIAPNAPENPVGNLYASADAIAFETRPEENDYVVNVFDERPGWRGPHLNEMGPVRFGNGAELTGYYLDDERLYLRWELPGPVSEDYHYFGHFLDADGEKRGQRDNILWPGRFWCKGDTLISWADIDLPEGTATLRVGLYSIEPDRLANSPVVDADGNWLNSWVDIALDVESE